MLASQPWMEHARFADMTSVLPGAMLIFLSLVSLSAVEPGEPAPFPQTIAAKGIRVTFEAELVAGPHARAASFQEGDAVRFRFTH